MGIGNPAWLTTVKRAFRSPTKKCCKRTEECRREDDEEEKKTEKRRWIFRKLTNPVKQSQQNGKHKDRAVSMEEERRAMAATEAAKVTAQAAVKSAKHTRLAHLVTQHYAALIIQTAFRAYLARQALRALKGIVKLQAMIRGDNVRKQAKMALKYMQALIHVQAKMRDHYSTPLPEGTRKSMFAETNNLWEKYKDICQRTSLTMDEGNVACQWEYCPYTIEDIEANLQSKKEAAIKCEKIRRNEKNQYAIPDKEANEKVDWLKQWMEAEKSDSRSISERRDSIKDINTESLQTPQSRRHSLHVASPLTPSVCNIIRSLHIQSASPRCLNGSRSQSTNTTPSFRSNCPAIVSNYKYGSGGAITMPNYMAATESAKAKARSQSTPRHRSSVSSERSERVGSVKKRLSYPMPESHSDCAIYNYYSSLSENLTSPSFRSLHNGGYGVEPGSVCSCYTESTTGGEISPASTSHVRRWFSLGNQ